MVDTVRQLCIKGIEFKDIEGTEFKVKQGKDYTTTVPEEDKENITLFSRYWVSVPKSHFVELEL